MKLLTALSVLVASALLLPLHARAEETVDPRYPLSIEATGDVGLGTTFTGFGTSQFKAGGSLAFGFPVSEKRQVMIGALGGAGSSQSGEIAYVGAFGGYRMLTFADPWRIRLDMQLAVDYVWAGTQGPSGQIDRKSRGLGLGGRVGFGIQYQFVQAFGAGLQLNLAAFAITPHVLFDLGPVLTFNW